MPMPQFVGYSQSVLDAQGKRAQIDNTLTNMAIRQQAAPAELDLQRAQIGNQNAQAQYHQAQAAALPTELQRKAEVDAERARANQAKEALIAQQQHYTEQFALLKEQAAQRRDDIMLKGIESREKAANQRFEAMMRQIDARGDRQDAPVAVVGDDGKPTYVSRKDAVGKSPAIYDPTIQGDLMGAKTEARIEGTTRAKALAGLPAALQQADQTIGLVDELVKHPGLEMAVGASSYIPKIRGTEPYNFQTRLDQLMGKQFLQAYETLKGGGQITEIEGKKATDAMSRMNPGSTEEEFKKAAKEFQDVLRVGIDRAVKQAAGTRTARSGTTSDWLQRAMAANPGMTAAQVAEEGRKRGKIP